MASISSANLPPGEMRAEHQEHRRIGQDSQLGPDGEKALRDVRAAGRRRYWGRTTGCHRSSRSPVRRAARPEPGTRARRRQPVKGRGAGTSQPGGAGRPRRSGDSAREKRAGGVEPAAGRRTPRRNSQCTPAMWAPRWLPTRIAPRPLGKRRAKPLVAAHLKSAEDRLVRQPIERIVARQEPRGVGCERRPGRLDRPVGIEGGARSLDRGAKSLPAPRPHRHGQPPQEPQDRVAARRRPACAVQAEEDRRTRTSSRAHGASSSCSARIVFSLLCSIASLA